MTTSFASCTLSLPHRYTTMRLLFTSCFLFNTLLSSISYVNCFSANTINRNSNSNNLVASSSSSLFSSSSELQENKEEDPLGLTDELRKMTNAFAMIGDDKLRYKQLLYMAQNGLKDLPEIYKIDENKVPGCLSTVHSRATAMYKNGNTSPTIDFEGDSDGLLTKGLVALLVRGLSGNTAEDIQKVDPSFIEEAQITQSLTPGRNNGFLNMLAKMKQQALDVSTTATEENDGSTESSNSSSNDEDEKIAPTDDDDDDASTSSLYDTIITTLQVLQPTILELKQDGTSNDFDLLAVADIFDGLSIEQRQQVATTVLGDVMDDIDSMNIDLLSQEEYDNRN